MCVIASAKNNAQQHEFDKKFVDTTNLQIPPEVYVQYRTLVYTMDQRAHECGQCGPILLILAALKFSQKNPLLTFIRFLFVDNRVGHLAISSFNKLLYCDIFNCCNCFADSSISTEISHSDKSGDCSDSMAHGEQLSACSRMCCMGNIKKHIGHCSSFDVDS